MMKNKIFWLFLIYFLIFGLIYGVLIINPFYTDWCLWKNPRLDIDIPINYLNFIAFMNSNTPVPFMDNNSFPLKTGVMFVDCLPVLAVVLKFLTGVLHKSGEFLNFQYSGIYGVLNFCLLGLLSFLFMKKINKTSDFNAFLCSLFFVTAPIFLERFPRNYALSSMWLILLSFVPLVYREYFDKNKFFLFNFLLGALSVSIHTSYVPVLFVNLCVCEVYDWFCGKNERRFSPYALILYPVGVFLIFGLMGGFSNNMTTDSYYGYFLFNWAGFVAPTYSFYNFSSVVLPCLNYIPCADYTAHEGFAYLGAGIILPSFVFGGGFCLVLCRKSFREKFRNYVNHHQLLCLLFGFLFLFMVLISSLPKICFMDKAFSLQLPTFVQFFYSVLRAAGRYIWTDVFIVYFLVLSVILRIFRSKVATIMLFLCLVVQMVDLKELFFNIHTDYALKKSFVSFVKTERVWDKLAEGKKNCFISDEGRYHTPSIYPIYFWGLKNGLRFNSMIYSRYDENENSVFDDRLINPTDEDMFVFLPFHEDYDLSKVNCYSVDNCSICVKNRIIELENYRKN